MSVNPLMDPSVSRSQNAETEMRSRQREIEQSRRSLNGGAGKDKETRLRESCEGFEAMFIQKMWEGMRASLPQDGLTHSRDEKQWQGMYDEELGKSMAKSGGIGLADMMMSQLSRNLQSASEVAATSTSRRRPMDIAPAPLLPERPVAGNTDVRPASAAAAAPAPTVALAGPKAPQSAGVDIYGEAAAPVAVQPDGAGAGGSASGTASADGAVATAATGQQGTLPPPEVQAALNTLAAQAGVAHEVGVQAAKNQSAMAAAAFEGLPPEISSTLSPRISVKGAPLGDRPAPRQRVNTPTRGRQAADAAGVNADSSLQNAQPASLAGARAARRSAPAAGSNIASMSSYPPAGQNMPTNPIGDAATDLMKAQVQPSVKTKL